MLPWSFSEEAAAENRTASSDRYRGGTTLMDFCIKPENQTRDA